MLSVAEVIIGLYRLLSQLLRTSRRSKRAEPVGAQQRGQRACRAEPAARVFKRRGGDRTALSGRSGAA